MIGKRGFFVLSLVLLAVGYFYVLAVGNTYVAKAPRDGGESEELIAWISEDSIGNLEILEIVPAVLCFAWHGSYGFSSF